MRGILTSWKRSRISKIIAVIIPLPLLLLSFLLGAVEVSASDSSSDQEYVFTTQNVSLTSTSYTIRWVPDAIIDEYNQWYSLDIDNGDYGLSVAPTNGVVTIRYIGYLSAYWRFTADSSIQQPSTVLGTYINYITASFSYGQPSYGSTYYQRCSVLDSEVSNSFYSEDTNRISNAGNTSFTFQNRGRYLDQYRPSNTFDIVANLKIEYVVTISSVSDANLNNQIRELCGSYPNSTINVTNDGIVCSWCPYSLYEIYDAMETKLYNIWIADNLIYDQLRLNGAANNFANTVNSELIRDAAQAHSDSLDIQDKMMNDSSNFSTNQNTLKNDIDVKQAAADTAVDGAVHQYTDDLDTVTDFQWNSFFTSQSGAATFWRDVGEYILNSSNLGFIATGLAIVTIITLFVFLLRL